MAEKIPEASIPKLKSLATEKMKPNVPHGLLTPEDRADESGETGYSSAQHSSDLLSGAEATSESAVWTSEDRGHSDVLQSREPSSIVKKQQKKLKNTKKQVESEKSDPKPEKRTERSPEKASKSRSHKKSTPPKQTLEASVKSSQEIPPTGSPSRPPVSAEATTPPKSEGGATPPKKGKSPKKSIFQKFKSPRKKSESSESAADEHKHVRGSSVTGTRSRSPKKEATASATGAKGSTKVKDSKESPNLEKSKSSSPPKRRGLLRIGKAKSPAKQKSTSTESETVDEPSVGSRREKGEKSPKKKSKVTLVKKKSQGEEQIQSGMKHSIATTCERVSRDIQNLQLSRKESDTFPLLPEEQMDTGVSDDPRGKSASGAAEGISSAEPRVESAAELRRKAWRPKNTLQKGGFVKDERVWASFESSFEETGTEMSTVSDSSAIQGGSESKKGRSSSSDTLSDLSGLKEEAATGDAEHTEEVQLHGQKRLKDEESSGSDEDAKAYRAICGSPVKKIATPKKSTEESSEE